MSKSINKVTLLGNVGQIEIQTVGEKKVAKISLATSFSFKKNDDWVENTTWHNVVCWNGVDTIEKHVAKGDKIAVQGRIDNRSYEKDGQKKYISEVIADDVTILSFKKAESSPVSDDDFTFDD